MREATLFLLLIFLLVDCNAQGRERKKTLPQQVSVEDSTRLPKEFSGARLKIDSFSNLHTLTLTFQRSVRSMDQYFRHQYFLDSVIFRSGTNYLHLSASSKDTLCLDTGAPFCQWSFIFPLTDQQFKMLLQAEIDKVQFITTRTGYPPPADQTLIIETYYLNGAEKTVFQHQQPISLRDSLAGSVSPNGN